jgi:hypothetical protein
MIKLWYTHVRDETMAPARMVSFMEQHAESCDICLQDPDLKDEIAKITELVLPESKIPKAIRQKNEQVAPPEEEVVKADDEEESTETEVDEENLDLADDPEILSAPDV